MSLVYLAVEGKWLPVQGARAAKSQTRPKATLGDFMTRGMFGALGGERTEADDALTSPDECPKTRKTRLISSSKSGLHVELRTVETATRRPDVQAPKAPEQEPKQKVKRTPAKSLEDIKEIGDRDAKYKELDRFLAVNNKELDDDWEEAYNLMNVIETEELEKLLEETVIEESKQMPPPPMAAMQRSRADGRRSPVDRLCDGLSASAAELDACPLGCSCSDTCHVHEDSGTGFRGSAR